jgi:5-methylcytosine-specific restriction endonuclease McrA
MAGPCAPEGVILTQNTDRQAAVVKYVREARLQNGDSLPALRRNRRAWNALVSRVEGVFWQQPLWRLQRIGDESLDFLYVNRPIGTRIEAVELRSGVAFCLRRFHVLITELVRGAWLQYIRKYNAAALGSTTDLAEFLFGSERCDVAALRPVLRDVQHGECFYCGRQVRNAGHLNHFIPWSRYPVDLGHNFVLADDGCNSAKGSMLAAEEHLARWTERNQLYWGDIQAACLTANIRVDLDASVQIAEWAYGQAVAVGAMLWVRAKVFTHARALSR